MSRGFVKLRKLGSKKVEPKKFFVKNIKWDLSSQDPELLFPAELFDLPTETVLHLPIEMTEDSLSCNLAPPIKNYFISELEGIYGYTPIHFAVKVFSND